MTEAQASRSGLRSQQNEKNLGKARTENRADHIKLPPQSSDLTIRRVCGTDSKNDTTKPAVKFSRIRS